MVAATENPGYYIMSFSQDIPPPCLNCLLTHFKIHLLLLVFYSSYFLELNS